MLVLALNEDGLPVNRQLVHCESHAELDSFYERIALVNCKVDPNDIVMDLPRTKRAPDILDSDSVVDGNVQLILIA